jgi:hypothetical protein
VRDQFRRQCRDGSPVRQHRRQWAFGEPESVTNSRGKTAFPEIIS